MIPLWALAASANGITALAYFGISATVLRGLARGGLRGNPLGVATAFIFASCGLGHAEHALHPIAPPWLEDPAAIEAARTTLVDPMLIAASLLAAGIGIWYWSLRARFPVLSQGATLFHDLEQQRRDALRIQHEIVEALERTEAALDSADDHETRNRLLQALDGAQRLIDDIIEEPRTPLRPGSLRRSEASQKR